MSFSERMGLIKAKSEIQKNTISKELRNQLWNQFANKFWHRNLEIDYDGLKNLMKIVWDKFFKKPIDSVSDIAKENYEEIRQFYFSCEWYRVFDFLEFIVQYPPRFGADDFKQGCNEIMKRELSAYRFVSNKIVEVSSDEEIAAIEGALDDTSLLKPVQDHIKCALQILSYKKSPDYRNAIKESISAVESTCKLITNEPHATLDKALNTLVKLLATKGIPIHPALKSGLEKLYGYTSDADGIRHGLMDESKLDNEDATFMLATCSAFVSYLIIKSQKAGLLH